MMRIHYTLSMPRPHTHLFHVRMEVKGAPKGGPLDLLLPAWTPGSYRVRDFARHVQDFSAGRRRWKKVEKSRWRIEGGGDVTVDYRVWAFELTVQTSHLDADHGFVNGAGVFMYPDGGKDDPVTLRVRAPRGWKIATGLERSRGRFTAPDYDTLADCPLEIGTFRRRTFRVRGVPHELVIHGEGNHDEDALVRDLARIVRTEAALMRDLPCRRYVFILHNTRERGGGLEHMNSTALQYPANGYRPREKYENFLELAAHEYFHLWNVKRIRPEPLGPFDYQREVHTPLLWVAEGITSYYDALFLCRAGISRPERYLRRIGERIRRYEEKPGRRRQSLSESSFDAWVKLYQPNENALNSQMSYYEKGELVGMCLDLELRRRTRNRKSLDDVMRALYKERERGYSERTFRDICERLAGKMDRFFDATINGVEEIRWNRFLGAAGLRLAKEPKKPEEGERRRRERAWLGVVTRRGGSTVTVASVVEGSPAWDAGLSVKDEIVALDGMRITTDEWEKRLNDRVPGKRMRIALFRAGHLREITVTLGRRENVTWMLRRTTRPKPLQKEIYEGWLGRPWKDVTSDRP